MWHDCLKNFKHLVTEAFTKDEGRSDAEVSNLTRRMSDISLQGDACFQFDPHSPVPGLDLEPEEVDVAIKCEGDLGPSVPLNEPRIRNPTHQAHRDMGKVPTTPRMEVSSDLVTPPDMAASILHIAKLIQKKSTSNVSLTGNLPSYTIVELPPARHPQEVFSVFKAVAEPSFGVLRKGRIAD